MKLVRWSYVAPRLLLLTVLVVTARFGLDPALRWLLVSSGESALGAKVELASLESSLREGKLTIVGLQAANPQSTMHNLFQAEQVQLEVDPTALLHRRLVVRTGQLRGLQINQPRSTSGERETYDSPASGESVLGPLNAKISELGEQWLQQVDQRWDQQVMSQLHTPRVLSEIEAEWQQQAATLRAQVTQLKQRGKELKSALREIKKNPLRGVERLPELQAELADVQRELKTLEGHVRQLPTQAQRDRQAIGVAKAQDEALLKQQLQFSATGGENLGQLLLGETVAHNLRLACDWIVWLRAKLPGNAAPGGSDRRSRGTVVRFTARRPDWEVQRVGVHMLATFGGQQLPLEGQLTALSSDPRLLAEPTRLTLQSTGGIALNAELVSDHRQEVPTEELHLRCPALPLAGATLGTPGKLTLQWASATAEFDARVRLEGGQLAGHIEFVQRELQLTPQLAPGSNPLLGEALAEAFASVNQLQAHVHLTGTLQQPAFQVESPLGKELTERVGTALAKVVRQRGESLLADVSQATQQRLSVLADARQQVQQQLLSQLGEHQQLVAELMENGSPAGLEIPQLSSKLGAGLLRK